LLTDSITMCARACPLQTAQCETVLHVALRMGHVTAVQLVLDAPNFDVVKCDSIHAHKVQ